MQAKSITILCRIGKITFQATSKGPKNIEGAFQYLKDNFSKIGPRSFTLKISENDLEDLALKLILNKRNRVYPYKDLGLPKSTYIVEIHFHRIEFKEASCWEARHSASLTFDHCTFESANFSKCQFKWMDFKYCTLPKILDVTNSSFDGDLRIENLKCNGVFSLLARSAKLETLSIVNIRNTALLDLSNSKIFDSVSIENSNHDDGRRQHILKLRGLEVPKFYFKNIKFINVVLNLEQLRLFYEAAKRDEIRTPEGNAESPINLFSVNSFDFSNCKIDGNINLKEFQDSFRILRTSILNVSFCTISGDLTLPSKKHMIRKLCLSHTECNRFIDFSDGWPEIIHLDGFRCNSIVNILGDSNPDSNQVLLLSDKKIHEALKPRMERWLPHSTSPGTPAGELDRADPKLPFIQHPWREFSRCLRELGFERASNHVNTAKRRLERDRLPPNSFSYFSNLILDWTSRYGYNPAKAILVSIGLVLFFSISFDFLLQGTLSVGTNNDVSASSHKWSASSTTPHIASETSSYRGHIFIRSDLIPPKYFMVNEPTLLQSTPTGFERAVASNCLELCGSQPAFSSIWYSIDVFVPLLDFGHENRWIANSRSFEGTLFGYLAILEKLLGAILTSIVIFGVSGLLRQDER